MFLHAKTATLYFFVEMVEAFLSSEGDIYLSYYANEPAKALKRARTGATPTLFTSSQTLPQIPWKSDEVAGSEEEPFFQ